MNVWFVSSARVSDMVQVNDAILSALLDGIAQFVTTFVRFPEEMLDYLAQEPTK